jgi:hypothetical protein
MVFLEVLALADSMQQQLAEAEQAELALIILHQLQTKQVAVALED